eukprot:CAMPEP_0204913412 /NCGR_PEP_ID=MMETSP1397-20131031/11291_1 /ASSEMBLY_ACC=CAM_ASM_000891 /TAXON_ID=49980 /ORGANISM="Climacostomum Climacostomum virens, Strain Stock W-24" /LENGTH=310 /DNA_ID=CAMNT_0052084639 /DNA_START=45 /DNA_END=977 /DNA_ORIENTATION=+
MIRDIPKISDVLYRLKERRQRPPLATLLKVECDIEGMLGSKPPAHEMNTLAYTGFMSEKLFSKLKSQWLSEASMNFNSTEFTRGFLALSKTDFIQPDEMEICMKLLRDNLNEFSLSSLIWTLRAFVLLDLNDEQLYEQAIKVLIAKGISNINLREKQVLHSALVGFEIDRPLLAKRLLAPLTSFRSELNSSGAGKLQIRSYSEDKIAHVLDKLGYRYFRNVSHAKLYELDFFIPSFRLAIEMLGLPYHTTVFGNHLTSNTKVKTRHLKRSGLHVVNVIETTDLENTLQKAIADVVASKSPVSSLVGGFLR